MISYAQNLEDVVLNRVFQSKPTGFYIDVGAHDPVELSVTKFFHDLGWRGINIEPVPSSFWKFKKERPNDINLNLAVGARHDFKTIYEVVDHPELTSLDREIAERAARTMEASVRAGGVEVRTLAEICELHCEGFIDFIKIDVEGTEREVIEGADWMRFRPTMVAVEATIPMTIIQDWDNPDAVAAWHEWEPLLLEAGYLFVYFDCLNRYYIRKEDAHLKNRFIVPVSWIQDQFQFYRDIRDREKLQNSMGVLEQEKQVLAKKAQTLTDHVTAIEGELKERQHQIETFMSELQQELDRKTAIERELEEREHQIENFMSENASLFGRINEIQNQKNELAKRLSEVEVDSSSSRIKFEERLSELQNELDRKREFAGLIETTLKQERWERETGILWKLFAPYRKFVDFITPKRAAKSDILAPSTRANDAYDRGRLAEIDKVIPTETARIVSEKRAESVAIVPPPPMQKQSSSPGIESLSPAGRRADGPNYLLYGPDSEEVFKTIRQSLNGEMQFIFALDQGFAGNVPLPNGAWCGLLHAVPFRIPQFLADAAPYNPFVENVHFLSSVWTRAKSDCKKLFVFSSDHAKFLAGKASVPVQVVRRPLPNVNQTWSPDLFENNPAKKVIQVGWWLQRLHAIHALPVKAMEKLWIRNPTPAMEEVLEIENKHLRSRFIIFDHMLDSVTALANITPDLYETLLCENIVFAHYYDARNLDLITQCIARRTPLLINPLPAVREYLGDDYPFYYYSYMDAASKVADPALLLKAHAYLKAIAPQLETGPQALARAIHESLREGIS